MYVPTGHVIVPPANPEVCPARAARCHEHGQEYINLLTG